MNQEQRKPLNEEEVVIHVAKGAAAHVRVVENEATNLSNEITVQVSKKRRTSALPVLGVIVK